jgi:hypothetical protein
MFSRLVLLIILENERVFKQMKCGPYSPIQIKPFAVGFAVLACLNSEELKVQALLLLRFGGQR